MKPRLIPVLLAGTALLITSVAITSCKKTFSKFKKPKACIDGPTVAEIGQEVTYTWCGDQADEITWHGRDGSIGKGTTFTVRFDMRTRTNISVTGRRKIGSRDMRDASANIDVEVGRNSGTWTSIMKSCESGGVIYNSSDLVNYRGYLYASKDDWMNDVTENSHERCIDSANGSFSTSQSSSGIYFKKMLATGSTAFVSVEYRNPSKPDMLLSNWSDLLRTGSAGLVNANNQPFQDNSTYAYLTESTKKMLTGKWRLTQGFIGSTPMNLPACNLDDYLRFYPNGTWKYFTGTDNCNGSSESSEGTFPVDGLPTCNSSSGGINLTAKSGPFSGSGSFSESNNVLKVYFNAGSSNGYYVFTCKP